MDLKVVVEEELKKGWEATNQLRSLLSSSPPKEDTSQCRNNSERNMAFMKNYSATILESFDNSISILKKVVRDQSSVGQITNRCPPKTRFQTIETPIVKPDGYTWRKYGKKSILNTKHPREYYRCAYREDQECQATKHVQKISDNPTNYRIAYYAHHTCHPLRNDNNAINTLDYLEKDFTNFISFESKTPITLSEHDFNPVTFNSSTSLSSMIVHPPTISVDTTTLVEPPLTDGTACLNNHDVLFSPRIFMSPNYMPSSNVEAGDYGFLAGDSSDMSGALLDDVPLWD